ncbi:NUDIX domain-containing protein [Brevundimonas sp. NPDC092305]|uniref:NUDIX domain-containing protein n=1 Tax=Brevundimonas sp. NPDC092305 TaxID=3363957 RepID=UPI00381A0D06
MSVADRVRVREIKVLSDNWYVLRKATFDWRRNDGSWQTQAREAYDRGNGVALLPYNTAARTVILTQQFRYPAFSNGHNDLLTEVPAGLLDDADPEARIRAEVEEEIGYRLGDVRLVFDCFMSPGSVTERLSLFIAEYDASMRIGDGGGLEGEGEEIEVLEIGFDEAMAQIADGRIRDAKTIILLQHAALTVFA